MKIGVLTLFPISELQAHHLKRSVSFVTLNSTGTSVCLILQIRLGWTIFADFRHMHDNGCILAEDYAHCMNYTERPFVVCILLN
jgi:hypothetical protein